MAEALALVFGKEVWFNTARKRQPAPKILVQLGRGKTKKGHPTLELNLNLVSDEEKEKIPLFQIQTKI